MNYKEIPIKDIQPSYYNPRKKLVPSDIEYQQIQRSIESFGFVSPVVVNEINMRCISGHQRMQVMADMGHDTIQCIMVRIENEAQEKALCIALNKIKGHWDNGKLRELMEDLSIAGVDLTISGFEHDELDQLLQTVSFADLKEDEEVPDALSDVICKIDRYHFPLTREEYETIVNEIKTTVGFTEEEIIEALKRRLRSQ